MVGDRDVSRNASRQELVLLTTFSPQEFQAQILSTGTPRLPDDARGSTRAAQEADFRQHRWFRFFLWDAGGSPESPNAKDIPITPYLEKLRGRHRCI